MAGFGWRWVLIVACVFTAPLGAIRTGAAAGWVPERALTTVGGYCADGEEQAFLGLINQYRSSNGLSSLAHSGTLAAAAEHHSVDMATVGYFSHTMSDGTSVSQNMANHGVVDMSTWGENIAAGNASAAATFQQWRNSPGHNANMLNGGFRSIGIGRATNGGSQYGTYWTTIFGGASDGPAAICGAAPITPTPAPAQPAPVTSSANATTTVALNLRSAPSFSAAVLAVMPAGSRVAVTGAASGGFLPVRFGTTSGWASVDYLTLDGGSAPAPQPTPQPTAPPSTNLGSATVTTALNLRAGAGVSYAILAVMPAGATVTVRGAAQGGFLPVRYGAVDGWASADYLSSGGSAPAPAPTPSPGSGGATLRTTTDLNLRAGPSLDGAVLLVMPPGAAVIDLGGQQNGFRQVRYGSTSGWASTTYLTSGGTTSDPGPQTRTATDDLNLRSGPGTGEAVLTVIPAGAAVAVTGPASGEWLPLRYAGVTGWSFAAYLV